MKPNRKLSEYPHNSDEIRADQALTTRTGDTNCYRVSFRQDEYRHSFIEAMSEADARQKFDDARGLDSYFDFAENTEITYIEEVK